MANTRQQSFSVICDYAGKRIQGGRDYQEDDFGFDASRPDELLMVLADGMGGHEGGAYASRLAVQFFMGSYHSAEGSIAENLESALHQTNSEIVKEIEANTKLDGMGCTLVAAVVNGGCSVEWISVGDSPLWLYRAGQLTRCNADHSMKPVLEAEVEKGALSVKDALNHPDRNMLRSALTGYEIELVDTSREPLELLPGDRLLLASDGVLTLSDEEIIYILQQSLPAKEMTAHLMNAIEHKHQHGQDNATAMTVIIPKPEDILPKKNKWTLWRR